jgi:hypothetical protein
MAPKEKPKNPKKPGTWGGTVVMWLVRYYPDLLDELRVLFPATYMPDDALRKLEASVKKVEKLAK